jgi:hypothetical protein
MTGIRIGPDEGETIPRGPRYHRVLAELPELEVVDARFGPGFPMYETNGTGSDLATWRRASSSLASRAHLDVADRARCTPMVRSTSGSNVNTVRLWD